MTRKTAGILCMILGALLILSAVLLVLYNRAEDERAGEAALEVMPEMVAVIEENAETAEPQPELPVIETTAPPASQPEAAEPTEPAWKMTVERINGHDYIGYLSIPALSLELPVMSEWSYPKLRIAPCRQFGTTRGNNLVIAGHNYQKHFGTLNKLTDQDVIFFTAMDGEISCYRVAVVDVIPPDSTEEVENSPYDLILYTCTYGGRTRVMVGGVKITKAQLDEMMADY